MNLDLAGRRIFVVGGSGLIGKAVARTFVDEGAQVMLGGRTESSLRGAVEELDPVGRGRVGYTLVNSTDPDSVRTATAAAIEWMEGLDVLINTGAPAAKSVIEAAGRSDEIGEILDAVDTKAMGYLRCARAAIPYLAESDAGRIVNICGQHTHLTDSIPASVRNVAVAALTKCLADELYASSITVNVVHPGPVVAEPDPSTTAIGAPGPTDAQGIASLVAFLASPLADTISGASIDIGHSIRGVFGF